MEEEESEPYPVGACCLSKVRSFVCNFFNTFVMEFHHVTIQYFLMKLFEISIIGDGIPALNVLNVDRLKQCLCKIDIWKQLELLGASVPIFSILYRLTITVGGI